MLTMLKSKENIALKGRLSHSATITKQIQEGISLTMKSWEVNRWALPPSTAVRKEDGTQAYLQF